MSWKMLKLALDQHSGGSKMMKKINCYYLKQFLQNGELKMTDTVTSTKETLWRLSDLTKTLAVYSTQVLLKRVSYNFNEHQFNKKPQSSSGLNKTRFSIISLRNKYP